VLEAAESFWKIVSKERFHTKMLSIWKHMSMRLHFLR